MAPQLVYTPVEEIPQIRERLRTTFASGRSKNVAYRKEQLIQLAYLFQDNEERFCEALKQDLGRPKLETVLSDVSMIIQEILFQLKHFEKWVKPEKIPFDINAFALKPQIRKEPKGVVLVISPFNYPLFCAAPIAGAIAAGCAVVLKPSELTPATSALLAELFSKYMDNDLYTIVNGAIDQNQELLRLQWDHILYTGGARVGRIVTAAASKHLTPVTLELGGKSPVIIDGTADWDLVAKRILWGKTINSGQTCTAPDYVLIPHQHQQWLINALKKQHKAFYNDKPRTSNSFSRIISSGHWERITKLIKNTAGEIVIGGETDAATKYIAPTVVSDVLFNDSLMSEEIFGPVLPIIPVKDIDAAIDYVNSQERPLALYVFSNDKKVQEKVINECLSGMCLVNDVLLMGLTPDTPFGGVGPSGYGAHKGKFSFDQFTHLRSSFVSPKWLDLILGARFPPYTDANLKKLKSAAVPKIPYPRPGTASATWIPSALSKGVKLAMVLAVVALVRRSVAGMRWEFLLRVNQKVLAGTGQL